MITWVEVLGSAEVEIYERGLRCLANLVYHCPVRLPQASIPGTQGEVDIYRLRFACSFNHILPIRALVDVKFHLTGIEK